MHFLGYLVYLAVLCSYFWVDKVNEQITVAYQLATEIVVGCLVVGTLPMVAFVFFHVLSKKELQFKQTFTTITNACASIVVSLGLIGTFVGLTDMISQIAGAVGAEGGSVEEQIATIMVAIGSSLDAMAFAFLTSVMGVAGSVIVLASGVFFREYFDPDSKSGEDEIEFDAETMKHLMSEQNQIKLYINKLIGTSLDRNEVASIVISNSKQTAELTNAVNTLSKSNSIEGSNQAILSENLSRQNELLGQLIAEQKTLNKILKKR
ncbi:conserved membrane hypothetical protein [Vibrio chagasii]|nr:conserved membrane hypothetical protein [Vibrio chagasii]